MIINISKNHLTIRSQPFLCIAVLPFLQNPTKNILYNNRQIPYIDVIKNYSLFNTSFGDDLTLQDICKIRNGIATLRDKIYIHDKKLYNEPCWKEITTGNTEKFVIYPYDDGTIIEEDIFQQKNPLTYNYLLSIIHR